MIYEATYTEFQSACQSLTTRRERLARHVMQQWLRAHVDPELPSEHLLAHIIAESLLSRLDRRLVDAKNIYLQSFDIPQIELFYVMTQGYPQVPTAHHVANQFLHQALSDEKRGSLLEIGIGKGVQVAELLRALRDQPGKLRELHVFAVDPDEANLRDSKARIAKLKKELPFKLRFSAVQGLLERWTPADFAAIRDAAGPGLVMNSAYTLHHTVHDVKDNEMRTRLLRALNVELSPRLFTLIEPSANHDTEDLPRRLQACWEHFGTVFDLIDRADIAAEHKFVIKEKFFGREIRDIFGVSDAFRCERHEPYESWLLRFAKAGFEPYAGSVKPRIDLPEHCTSRVSDGLVRLGYRGSSLIAVFAQQGGAPGGHA